ncbi:hypothetical protein LH428_10900 [Laribacter hongkongensis]|uniref:hypothetical protein n=1 Tax=Laribacter hongkongensis TaxID=168471 RepID=UPI001EFE8862|nr:hypothetical protein [Laribacter hongkongensis]MCG9116346.1 hypothetical protein [Laribacter hongkongensis]
MNNNLVANRYDVSVNGRNIVYYHFPAENPNSPVLFILHGHDFAAQPTSYRNRNWHVVCPMDRFGIKKGGGWFLGEDGDFFWIDGMRAIVQRLKDQGAGDIYFWGSSMGGFGSLLHGYLNRAKAVYANVPQTKLLGTAYSDFGMRKYFEKIFGSRNTEPWNDLKKVITEDVGCYYFLCFNQFEKNNYFVEHCLPFVSHLNSIGAPLYLEVRPLDTHGKNHGISETIMMFERFVK